MQKKQKQNKKAEETLKGKEFSSIFQTKRQGFHMLTTRDIDDHTATVLYVFHDFINWYHATLFKWFIKNREQSIQIQNASSILKP